MPNRTTTRYEAPPWLVRCQLVLPDVFRLAKDELRRVDWSDRNAATVSRAALLHVDGCLFYSNTANVQGQHSVAVTLLRSCAEAMTLVELGFQDEILGAPLIRRWQDSKVKAGELRQVLERDVWPRYDGGLWSEPWTEFYAELCRAIQPYSHYSQQIMLWQFHTRTAPKMTEDFFECMAAIGPDPHDIEKANQVSLLQTLLVWVLGRITLENRRSTQLDELASSLNLLRVEMVASGYLTEERGKWSDLLLPVFWSGPIEGA